MNLIAILDDLGWAISSKFDNVNCGGCGVVATFVAQCLEWCNITPRIKVKGLGNNHIDYHRAHLVVPRDEATVVDWNEAGLSVYHIVVEFDYNGTVYHFDSNGVVEWCGDNHDDFIQTTDGSLTIEEALTMISTPSGWNTQFNRDQIPAMMEVVARHLSSLQ